MDTTELVEALWSKRNVALWVGALVAGIVVVTQAFLALWFASFTPGSAWRTCLGFLLGAAAPTAGVIAYFWGDRADSARQGIARLEFASAAVGLCLIVPTFMLVLVSYVGF